MSDQAMPVAPASSGRRRAGPARRDRRSFVRPALWSLVAIVVLVLLAAGWIGVRAMAAKGHVEVARDQTDVLRAALLDGDTDGARVALARVQSEAARARSLTGDPVWRAAGALPVVGASASAVTTTTDVADDVAQRVLPILVEQGDALTPSKVRVAGNQLDLSRFRAAAPQLELARVEAAAAAARAHSVDPAGLPAQLRSAVTKAQSGLDDLASLTANASDAARLMPSMLGADGPRRYFVAFQSNAELRGTGGLVGAYAVLEADHGKLQLVKLGPRTDLESSNGDKPAVDFGADYRALYGEDPGLWVNTNLSAHFPYAAQLWLAMYEKQTGKALDGAIATDPVGLAGLLGATGPATLSDGSTVTAQNAARLTMKDVYAKFPDSDAKRDAYLQDVARAVFTNLLAGKGEPDDIAHALGEAAGGGRLLVYSGTPAEQAVLATTPLGGSVVGVPGPSVGVFINSGSASKLDYYLDAKVDYGFRGCTPVGRQSSTVTMTLRSTAPTSGLTGYVTGPTDSNGRISNLELVDVHLPVGASLTGATLDGKLLAVSPHRLLGRPVVTFPVRIAPGQSHEVVLDLVEPPSAASADLRVQPLATPARTSISGERC